MLLCLLWASGCYRVPPGRTLSPHYRHVFVPMFKNKSFEPDVEEDVTRFVQESFLADGRLRVSGEMDADLVLEGVITDFESRPTSFENDEFPSRSRIDVVADVTAYDPLDADREYPLGKWKNISAAYSYASNTRRVLKELDVDAKRETLEWLASAIVFKIIHTPPDVLYEEETPTTAKRDTTELLRRQLRFRSAYPPPEAASSGQ